MSTLDDTIYRATDLINKQNLGRAGNLFAYIHDPAHADRIVKGGMVVAGIGAVGLAAWGLNHRIAIDPASAAGNAGNAADSANAAGNAAGTSLPVRTEATPAGPAPGAGQSPPAAAPPLQLNPQVPVVRDVDDKSFSEAFEQARTDLGPGALFLWRGKAYNTFLEDEWEDLGSEGQYDYIRSLVVEHKEYYDTWADAGEAVPEPAPVDAVYLFYVWEVTAVITEDAPAAVPPDEGAGSQAALAADAEYSPPAYGDSSYASGPDPYAGNEDLLYGAGGADA